MNVNILPLTCVLIHSVEHSPSWKAQLVKKFPSVCGTQRFFTAFISACHPSLSWARSIQAMPPLPEDPSQYYPPIYTWVFQVVSFPQVSSPKPYIHLSSSPPPYMLHGPPILFSLFDHPNNVGWGIQIIASHYVFFFSPLWPRPP